MEVEYVGAKVIAELWGWKQKQSNRVLQSWENLRSGYKTIKDVRGRIPIDALKPG